MTLWKPWMKRWEGLCEVGRSYRGRRFGGDDVSEYEKTSPVADHPAVFGNGGIFGCWNFETVVAVMIPV